MSINTLRSRLILSHLLPTLVIIPLMGIALVYVLETQLLLANLSEELMGQAKLVAEMTHERSGLWRDADQAGDFVDRLGSRLTARVMLLDARGYLLASSDPADAPGVGQHMELAGLDSALAGQTRTRVRYTQFLYTEVADVLVPVQGPDQEVVGIVRLTNELADIHQRFLRLRSLILGVSIGGLLLGAAVGWVLALNLEQPLQQATQAVFGLVSAKRPAPLLERGPHEIRLLLRAVNSLMERLHGLEQARRQLLANLVHELGRPLGALRSAIQALLSGADQDPTLRQELLIGMDEEAGRLQRLLEDLAHLYDQVLGVLELDRRPMELSQWLPPVLAPWREAAQDKGLRWEASISADLPTLELDPYRLGQAVSNLLSNAIKYTPPGGAVSVHAGVEDSAVCIRVGDTGPGIDPEEQALIFNSFYRGRSAGRFPQGMGLGLTIARDLVAAHGGRLEVDSAPQQGSRFTIWIPLIVD